MTSRIAGWSVRLPADWDGWDPGDAIAAAARVAATLTSTESAARLVRSTVTGMDGYLGGEDRALVHAAIWVPDSSTGQMHGFLAAELVDRRAPGGLISAEKYHAMVRRRRAPRGRKVFDRSTVLDHVDAGPAVVVTETFAEHRARDVTHTVQWTVFPGDAGHALRLDLTTLLPAAMDLLTDTGRRAARSLEVALAPDEVDADA